MAANDVFAPPTGISGLKRFSGYVYDEFLKELQGVRGRALIREYRDNDPVIGAMLFATKMLIRQVDWRVNAATDAPDDLARAEFIDTARNDMEQTWEDTLSEILEFLPFGFAWHEITYKRRMGGNEDPGAASKFNDGAIGWRGFEGRAQETLLNWSFDDFGNVTFFNQLAAPDYRLRKIPRVNSLHFRTESIKNNPEGRSVLRNAITSAYKKKHLESIEGIAAERDLAGMPVGWVPAEWLSADASPDEKASYAAVQKIVTSIKMDEQTALVMPSQYDDAGHKMVDITLMASPGAKQFDLDKIINRYDVRIAVTMLADFILLGHEAVGSKALSTDKTDMFSDAISAWLDSIAAEINQRAIPKILALNGMVVEDAPQLGHGRIEPVDLLQLAQSFQALAAGGFTFAADPDVDSWVRGKFGMPGPAGDQAPVGA